MTLPAAGWFPDPQDTSRLRWWDGRTWGAATRALPSRAEPVAPVVVAPVGPSFSVQPTVIRSHSWASGGSVHRLSAFASLAVLLAAVSVVANPWGVCSAAGALVGVLGVAKPGATGGWRVLARSASASAVVLAVATGAVAASAQFHLF